MVVAVAMAIGKRRLVFYFLTFDLTIIIMVFLGEMCNLLFCPFENIGKKCQKSIILMD